MNADQVAFAVARLDEDQTTAREGQPDPGDPRTGEWTAYGHQPGPKDRRQDRRVQMVGTETEQTGWMVCEVGQFDRAPMIAAHIARYDPARVLREVGAARRILARYQDCLARMEDPDYPQGAARDQAREYEDFVLPNLLVRWAGHPDYDQEWKP